MCVCILLMKETVNSPWPLLSEALFSKQLEKCYTPNRGGFVNLHLAESRLHQLLTKALEMDRGNVLVTGMEMICMFIL